MQIAMIGLGRMGANMVRRLMKDGHDCIVYDRSEDAVVQLASEGAVPSKSPAELCQRLAQPRVLWLMVPAGVVDSTIEELVPLLDSGDTLIDGGNSYYIDDIRRSRALAEQGLHYLDVGTSGGVFGLERGYCQMIGGEADIFARLEPIFQSLAPPFETAEPTPDRNKPNSTADKGYLHCGGAGAGHFVKMVHNGIEYGLMAAYSEGFNILRQANVGADNVKHDAETTPMRHPEHYQYDFDVGEIAELWRRGSVVTSWLLDLTAHALLKEPDLSSYSGKVSDSGEGRWTLNAAIDESVPAPVLSAALYQRFSSRGESDFADKILSAMRSEFGGHSEKK
ncbi:MAG: phosphogluconate dehydrogenase (NAD(+)-dependent, decarboxylating) [Pseudomonadota bacterium]